MDHYVCKREARKLFDNNIDFYVVPKRIKIDNNKENLTICVNKKFKKKNNINDFDELFIWFCSNYCISRVNGSYPVFYVKKGE